MANFTETTNYKFKKPTVGADTDQWGTHLNETIDGVDSQLKTLADSITSQQLEQLGNVVNVTPVDDQFLRYNGTNWSAETVPIPDALNDLSNVSGTPSSGDVLTYNGSAWSPASVTSAAVADGSVTNAKLHPSLQTVIGRILVTDDDDSPTDNQILVYSTSDAEWKYADQAGSTLQTLTDVSTTGLSDGDLMKYDGTSGEFVFIDAAAARTLLNVDVSGTDNSTAVTLNTISHDYLTLSSQQISLGPIVLTDDVSGTLPIANGGTSATTAAGARTSLGLGTLATQSTITESQISDLQPYITASSTDTLTNKSGNISQWTNDSGYLTAETNDLSTAVTWTNVPDANITQSSVTQHQGALTITESQISDLQNYLTAETNDLGSAVTGTLPIANGGTGQTTASAARIALLPTLGTAGQVLAVNTGTTDVEWVDAATGGGSGTVTSVAISGTDGIEVDSGSPVTTSGTIALGINAATLSSHLSLGTAATTASTDYATAAQGSLADSAVQPGDDAADLGSGTATDGYVLTADGAGGAAWEAASGGGGGSVSGRNLIINGDFRVNQRGAASRTATSNAYNYDRWYYDGTYLYQVIEDLNIVNGDYTISWSGSGLTAGWVISSNTTSSIPASFTAVTSGSSFTVSGKTTGDHLWIRFSGTLTNLADVQVEAGTVSTPFERRLIGTELALCQRYYQKFNNNISLAAYCGGNSSDLAYRLLINHIVSMRATPTVILPTYTTVYGSVTLFAFTPRNAIFGEFAVLTSSAQFFSLYTTSSLILEAEL